MPKIVIYKIPSDALEKLPKEGIMKIFQVLRLLKMDEKKWYQGVKDGRYPKPVKYRLGNPKMQTRGSPYLGYRDGWRVEDIRAFIEKYTQ